MKKIILILVLVMAVVGIWAYVDDSNGGFGDGGAVKIQFPAGGETLTQGQAYTLTWKGGPEEIQIFLVDTALKSQGASVSVSDRVYGIENTGSYQYVIPRGLPEGTYEFQIGDATSKEFRISGAEGI
jgi:hypothetical protein